MVNIFIEPDDDECNLITPGRIYFGVTLLLAFFLAGIWHEVGHAIGNGLTGGDWGLTSDTGIVGGYDISNVYFMVPVFTVDFIDLGHPIVRLLGGPLSVIFLGWYVGLRWNPNTLSDSCGGLNKWMIRRGVVWGLLVRTWFNAVYLLPIDVFPERHANGDGTALQEEWVERGFFIEEIAGIPWFFSAQHVIGAIAIIGTAYVTWVVIQSHIMNCSPQFTGSCEIDDV